MKSLSFIFLSLQPVYTSYGIALKDSHGDRGQSELEFARGSFITNIQQKTADWCIGDHRGDKQKYFKRECVQLLRKEELMYLNELVSIDIIIVSIQLCLLTLEGKVWYAVTNILLS